MFLNWMISLSLAASPSTTLLIKAPDAASSDFFVYAQNSGESKMSQAALACENVAAVTQTLKEGQFLFLNGSMESAKNKFEQIADLKWSCDWREDERKIIAFSFFRLAQISQNPSEQMNLLSEAINFDDTQKPDTTVFPPPLVELFEKTKAQMLKKDILFPESAKKFTGLYRNGKFISLSQLGLTSYPMKARLTLISDTYKTETFVVTPDEFQKYQISPTPLVVGDCEKFDVSDEIKNKSFKIFFNPDCIKGNNSLQDQKLISQTNLNSDMPTPLAPRKKTWLERNLLWVGIAVVSSIAVSQMMKNNQQTETVTKPTNTLSEK